MAINEGEGVAVSIIMNTQIKDGENEETVQIATNGKLFKKNTSLYLQFKEERQETGSVNQIIKIDDCNKLAVTRQGAVSMKQQFLLGETTAGIYRSPLGEMLMETKTTSVEIEINEQQMAGTINMSYQLHMQHQYAGDYHVSITFRRMNE
ncbi:DUF1934 domain-containing protein [Bacillaceae bacterium IKA-2]|nr:DUF1934 domain-containing protein [Bacillaceae bacterium IKA-2]